MSVRERRFNRRNAQSTDLCWEGQEYPHIESGVREIVVTAIQGPEWVHRFRRWSIRIVCQALDEPVTVSAFVNLGTGEKPCLGRSRQSRIYQLICLALGRAPDFQENINLRQILIGRFFLVKIEDCDRNSRGDSKVKGEVYSRVTEFIKVAGPRLPLYSLSRNHEAESEIN